MPKRTDYQVVKEAIRLRTEERLRLIDIAARVGYSNATCCRWLRNYPLTPAETKQIRAIATRKAMTGKKQSTDHIRKRVENSREKIRAKAIERMGGAWATAKNTGQVRYISRKPCKKGHTERYTRSRECVRCSFDKQRNPANKLFRLCTAIRYRAKHDNLAFDLTPEYLKEIWPLDDACPILHKPFIYVTGEKQQGAFPFSPSVDRFIPALGYVKGNVAIVSHYINTLKNNCTDPAVFRQLADWMENSKSFRA
jgi:hypothetical protein